MTQSGFLCVFLKNDNLNVHSFHLSFPPLHLSDVEQMAIDWLTGNFYFVDDVDDRVFVCNKNGQTCVTLLDQELYNPKGIALDPVMGFVLFTPVLLTQCCPSLFLVLFKQCLIGNAVL